MLVINCEQGSTEWHQARAGVITASMFSEVRKRLKTGPNKGEFSVKAKEYGFRLAVERIAGELLSEDKFDTWEMRRGRELEPIARLKHEEAKGILVEQTGIVLTADRLFGASVDGFIDNDGSSEYKCFVSPSSLMPIILRGDVSDCIDQVQGGLWITGRKWCDFVLYCPALEKIGRDLTIKTIARDEEFIAGLEKDLLDFNNYVEEMINKIKGDSDEYKTSCAA